MTKIAYLGRAFSPASREIIDRANVVIEEYAAEGFALTLRQLYYQFVARGWIANKQKEYKRIGSIINDARLAGEIDWEAIEDRTRSLRSLAHWDSPAEIVSACASQFRVDKWDAQDWRPEVWIEKDALIGVIEGVCERNDVPYFSCRGYTSQSEMWSAAQRLLRFRGRGQTPIVLHLGDHDPSGKDMTRDIFDRLELFMSGQVEVRRLALNWNQIEEFQPPPNPAKTTDSRAAAYIAEFGSESWELDALDPRTMAGLIERAIESVRDDRRWKAAIRREDAHRSTLGKAAQHWPDVAKYVNGNGKA